MARLGWIVIISAALTGALRSRPSQSFGFQISAGSQLANAQAPMMSIPDIVAAVAGKPAGHTVISDVIGLERSLNIFAGLTRDVAGVAERLQDRSRKSTVLAPLNSAVAHTGRKPWEDQDDYDTLGAQAYEGSDGQDRAQVNLRRYVEAHVVPTSPWPEGEEAETMSGQKLKWESKDGKKVVR